MRRRGETDAERVEREFGKLMQRTVWRADGTAGVYSPFRGAGIGALLLFPLLLFSMVVFGGVQVGRYPLAERLFAGTVAVMVVSLVAGLLVLLGSRGRPRVRHVAMVLLGTALATVLSLNIVLLCWGLLPLHLDGLLPHR